MKLHPIPFVLIFVGLMLVAAALNQQKYQPRNTDQSSQHDNQVSQNIVTDAVAITRDQYAPIANPRPSRAEYREEKDLQAQRQMAYWTVWVAITSVLMMLITAFGVLLIGKTLKASEDGLSIMQKTLREAEKATEAANATVEVTRAIGDAQNRAWLLPSELEGGRDPQSGDLAIRFVYTNSGNSPAFNFQSMAGRRVIGTYVEATIDPLPPDRDNPGQAIPKGGYTYSGDLPIAHEHYMAFKEGRVRIFATCWLEYTSHGAEGVRRTVMTIEIVFVNEVADPQGVNPPQIAITWRPYGPNQEVT